MPLDAAGPAPSGEVPAVGPEVGHPDGAWEPGPASPSDRKRESFGRHLEAHYARLVGQMFAITLDAQEAHDAVQDAYARAWRKWDVLEHDDPTRWVLRVAVSGTTRSWRSLLGRVGLYRHPLPPLEDVSPRTAALIGALYRLSPAERRAVVMFHMAGATTAEIAALERTSIDKVSGRLSRARLVVTEDMVDVFLDVLGPGAPTTRRV